MLTDVDCQQDYSVIYKLKLKGRQALGIFAQAVLVCNLLHTLVPQCISEANYKEGYGLPYRGMISAKTNIAAKSSAEPHTAA